MYPSTNQPLQANTNPNILPQTPVEPLSSIRPVQPQEVVQLPQAIVAPEIAPVTLPNHAEHAPAPIANQQAVAAPEVLKAQSPDGKLQQPGQVWSGQVHTDAVAARQNASGVTELIAEDVALIEKPWVEKSEHDIEQNQDDPFKLDEEQNTISKAYLKKRFNIDVS